MVDGVSTNCSLVSTKLVITKQTKMLMSVIFSLYAWNLYNHAMKSDTLRQDIFIKELLKGRVLVQISIASANTQVCTSNTGSCNLDFLEKSTIIKGGLSSKKLHQVLAV